MKFGQTEDDERLEIRNESSRITVCVLIKLFGFYPLSVIISDLIIK